jgi:purine nucleosidase
MKHLILLFCLLIALPLAAAEEQKIILDCDLAGDIDDAFAVSLALASPELEILGLVMDHGDTPKRAQVACRLLYECGLESIPVFVGRPTPNVVGVDKELAGYSNQFYWGEGFDRVKPSEKNAADFIIETLHKYPKQVILFTVGPVPNMEDVLQKDPQALTLAKKVVSMFGSFYMGYGTGPVPDAEWNVKADEHASKLFVESGADLLFAGLDVTTFVKLNEENRIKLLFRKSPMTDALCALYSLWGFESYSRPDPTLFDVVAVGMVLWPDLFTTRKVHVQVVDGGYTVIDESKSPNCRIGMTINTEEFIKRVMERYMKQNFNRLER